MNDQHLLHFGDEPPKIEGCYLADSIYRFAVIKVPSSPWMVSASLMPGLKNYYKITDQHKGTAKMNFLEPHGSPGDYDYYNVNSVNDSTYYYISRDESRFINDSIAPAYFKSSQYSVEDFHHVYIIGDAPYFTAYYYEIRDIKAHFLPLNAVIISGRVDKEITVLTDTVSHTTDTIEVPVIKDLAWGVSPPPATLPFQRTLSLPNGSNSKNNLRLTEHEKAYHPHPHSPLLWRQHCKRPIQQAFAIAQQQSEFLRSAIQHWHCRWPQHHALVPFRRHKNGLPPTVQFRHCWRPLSGAYAHQDHLNQP